MRRRKRTTEAVVVACEDCKMPYEDFPLDVILSPSDWTSIQSETWASILCSACIVKRASCIGNVQRIDARVVFMGTIGAKHSFDRYAEMPDMEAISERLSEICDCPHDPTRTFRRDCDTCLDGALIELVAMTRRRDVEALEGFRTVLSGFAGDAALCAGVRSGINAVNRSIEMLGCLAGDNTCATCGGATSCNSDTCTLEPGKKPYGDHCSCEPP